MSYLYQALSNRVAHGSAMLPSQVLGTIELVAEILGQRQPSSSNGSQS